MKRSSVSHQIGVESTQKGRSSPEALPRGSLVHAALVDLRWALAPLLVCTTAVLLTIAGCGAAAIIPARPRFRPRNGLGCPHPADVATRDGDPLPPLNSFPGAPAACGGLRCRGHHRPCRTGRSGPCHRRNLPPMARPRPSACPQTLQGNGPSQPRPPFPSKSRPLATSSKTSSTPPPPPLPPAVAARPAAVVAADGWDPPPPRPGIPFAPSPAEGGRPVPSYGTAAIEDWRTWSPGDNVLVRWRKAHMAEGKRPGDFSWLGVLEVRKHTGWSLTNQRQPTEYWLHRRQPTEYWQHRELTE